jgi:Na+/melibiose symporter-like transporter
MSEEDKCDTTFDLKSDLKKMIDNRSFMLIAISSAILIVDINQMSQTILNFFNIYTSFERQLKYSLSL